MSDPVARVLSSKQRLRAASEARQRRIIVARSMEPSDYQFRGGSALEWSETMRAGVYAARRKLVTYLDFYHWQWAIEHKRITDALAGLELRFSGPLTRVKHAKERKRLERRKWRLKLPLLDELAEHCTNPRKGITGDQADAGHRFMGEYQTATRALAGGRAWIGERVGGGGGAGYDAAAIMGGKLAQVIRALEKAKGKECTTIICAVCGRNASLSGAAREAGLADRKGKAVRSLRVGLEFLRSWYGYEVTREGRSRRS